MHLDQEGIILQERSLAIFSAIGIAEVVKLDSFQGQ
ncbi:hypothetical protein C21_01193 [Arenibacter sp. NBRC 103722]|nr:hypothetical protein C21_01193 [Arenibacter sp. NBRC 103722]